MLDLEQMEHDRVVAQIDKSDLFDFYNHYYFELLEEVKELRGKLKAKKPTGKK